jgi:transposase
LVENAFGRIKQYRGIATRYEKLERNYHSMLALAFTMMWLRILMTLITDSHQL